MAERPLEGMMSVTLDKIREMVGSNTIIGEPITLEGTTILPVSKVTFGFASGGSDFGAKTTKELFGGGSGAGVSVTPVAFLVIKDGNVRTIQLADHNSTVDRALNMVPELVDKLTGLLNKGEAAAADPAQNQ
ncbi:MULTISPECIES: GerW family sporulation protein [Eubacteriales]|uniref:GerW family sporulation protein n=1 Tax=Eubacteriales TaxID=186802 RepID=UPI000B374B09|nr:MULTISPECIES: GerW family sporulation protein [Eubacteriales]MDY4168198.1 GerW family sporulation protein [Fournierella sp.]OUP23381.1 sporulation protein YtfJ [Gemmiger sp. An194]